MPVAVRIDPARKIVFAELHGTLTHGDLMRFQREVWARPELAGHHELVDMGRVEEVAFVSPEFVAQLASTAAGLDHPLAGTRLAIVAVHPFHRSLAAMYKQLREADPRTVREVESFDDLRAAEAWIAEKVAATSR